jgi:hypothetical protein
MRGHSQKLSSAVRRLMRGYTIVSLTVTTLTAGIMIAGGWMSYASFQRQWKIANAERMMDQYAHSAMKELTNDLSWAWGAYQVSGGYVNPRWRIYMEDIISEYGSMDLWKYRREGFVEGKRYIMVSYRPNLGILINDVPPKWAGDLYHKSFLWTGTEAGRGQIKAFDQRDHMSVEAFQLDFNRHLEYPVALGNPTDILKRQSTVKIRMVMHYSYNAGDGYTGLYGGSYVRERVYETQVSMRNWDVERNPYRDDLVGIDNSGS